MQAVDKYAMYLRKSRADVEAEKLGEGETLARHKKILTELAARQGLFVADVYQEIVSGETIAARPEIQKLIKACYGGKYRGIIIIDVDRLSRGNQGDMQVIMDCLRYSNSRNGLLVVTPTKTYDVSHNADDEEYMEFVLFMSRREYKTIQKRLERGRRQAVVEGNYMGSYRPYGYDILKTKSGRTLLPNPEEAPVVKMIFELRVKDNMTPGEIARRLDAMGVPTYSGDPEWSLATIKDILTNPTYTGKVRWNDRMCVKTMVDGRLVTSRPRSNKSDHYMLYEGKHQAIIDDDLFSAAASKFYSDKTKANLALQNPLAGVLVCKNCGKAMRYRRYVGRPNCVDRYYHAPSQICAAKSARADDVIGAVVQALRGYIDNFKVTVDNLPETNEESIQGQLEALQREQAKIERRLSRLFDAWEDGTITNNEFAERKAVNNKRIESVKSQIAALEDSIPDKEMYEEKIMYLSDALNALQDDSLDADVKNAYIKAVVSRIEISYADDCNREFALDVHIK